ncbi:MAG: hypothetical protein M3Z84_02950 [Actinomycetota bacterium]|nr:hypothetical protein [Actinomycetota bacterium]
MDATTVAGCRAKADPAEASVQELAGEWTAWLNTNPYPSRIDIDPDLGEHRIVFDFSTPLPLHFPVRVGEIAHDLRSALDHLVWREAFEILGHEPTGKQAREIAFPIWRTRAGFKESKVKRYVSPDAWTIIERYQPYDRGKPKRSKALGLLHWINRIDKHRLLHGGYAFLGYFNPLQLVDFNREASLIEAPVWGNILGRPLKRETKIAWLRFDPNGPEPTVRVKRTPALSVSYGDAPGYLGRVEIGETVRKVGEIVNDFAYLLP